MPLILGNSQLLQPQMFSLLYVFCSLFEAHFIRDHNMPISFICLSYILLLHIPSYRLLLPSGRAPQCDLHQLSQSFVEFISAVLVFIQNGTSWY